MLIIHSVILFCALHHQATSSLRKEQENEVLIHERMREHRKAQQEMDLRYALRFHIVCLVYSNLPSILFLHADTTTPTSV